MEKYFIFAVKILFCFIFIQNIFAQQTEPVSIHQYEHQRYSKIYPQQQFQQKPTRKPVPLQKRQHVVSKEVFGYHPYWMNSAYPNYNYSLLSTIAYFGVEVNSQGNIIDYHSWPVTGLINRAHSYGVKVVLVAINFDTGSLTTLLSNATNRTRLVNNLLEQVQLANADGVNIDFEKFPSSQRQNLNVFMKALADTFHKHIPHSSVSIALPAVNWSNKFDYNFLAQVCDALFIMGYNYYWTGGDYAGPVAPLSGWGTYNITWTVNDYLNRTFGQNDKIILGLPYYGIKWPTQTGSKGSRTTGSGSAKRYSAAENEANAYSKLWDNESMTPWYRHFSARWYQCWFDDSLSLTEKYKLAKEKNLQGVGMWALGYDGDRPELWGALRDQFGIEAPPVAVENFRVQNIGGGLVRISAAEAADADGYHVYMGTNRNNFHLAFTMTSPMVLATDLLPDSAYFFKMTAYNQFGESPPTETLTAAKADRLADILIVNGYDRMTVPGNTRDFAIEHGSAIKAAGYAFDSASNEAVINGDVYLTNYKVVDWISGQESTEDETFSNYEQLLVQSFLQQGGKLFVSGSEIGWDLDQQGTADDQDFYRNYLKANFFTDRVEDYTVTGISGSIFENVEFSFGDSTANYSVNYPDGIQPAQDATACLSYNDQYIAGIQFSGTLGIAPTKVVNFGFPFETIYPAEKRNQVMERILTFFFDETGVNHRKHHQLSDYLLLKSYPNPFNQNTSIEFQLPEPGKVSVQIFNILGEKVKSFYDRVNLNRGSYQLNWNGTTDAGTQLPSGLYYCTIIVNDQREMIELAIVK